jgi:hypothetical protein
MSVITHIETLDHKYQLLENQIRDAHIHRLPTIHLKKRRLKIRDEIERLRVSVDGQSQAA